MSLLDDFNGICEAQDNSIEMKLHKFAQQDKAPNVYSLNEINQICYVSHLSGKLANPTEILEPNKIYIICNTSIGLAINLLNPSAMSETLEAYKNQYLIGSKEDGFTSLAWGDVDKYISIYKIIWGDKLGNELNYKIWEKSLKNNYYDMDTVQGTCSNDGSRAFHPITMKVDYSKDMFDFI